MRIVIVTGMSGGGKSQAIKILEDNSVSPDGVIVETLNTRLDSRISAQISEIAQKMLTGEPDELE